MTKVQANRYNGEKPSKKQNIYPTTEIGSIICRATMEQFNDVSRYNKVHLGSI